MSQMKQLSLLFDEWWNEKAQSVLKDITMCYITHPLDTEICNWINKAFQDGYAIGKEDGWHPGYKEGFQDASDFYNAKE